jgi:hypothetical protein
MLASFQYAKSINDVSSRIVFIIEDTDEYLKGIDISNEDKQRQFELNTIMTDDPDNVIKVLGLMKQFRCFRKDKVDGAIHYISGE